MTDQDDGPTWRSSEARGERAWKEATDRIASRNDAVQKAGKQEREAYERAREDARRARSTERREQVMKRPAP
jgi:hypothetical protein